MKKMLSMLVPLLACYSSYAQNNQFPEIGPVLLRAYTNTTVRPVINQTRIAGEIAGYSATAALADDGFLRLSAGGGTSSTVKSFIDLSGYSTIPDMNGNVTIGTSGIERLRITKDGNVGIGTASPGGKLDVTGAVLLSSYNNTSARPLLGETRIPGEIAGYSATAVFADDGFLRLSAGGGTSSNVKSFIDLSGYSTVPDMNRNIIIGTSGTERMRITSTGNIGIGTSVPREALSVNGNIRSKQVVVETDNWPDYVFHSSYHLPSLSFIKTYIDQNQHLPEMPSEKEITSGGLNLGEINKLLTKKIEELTLYLIDQQQQIKDLKAESVKNKSQEERIKILEQKLNTLLSVMADKN